jgi:hypothetical protein
MYRRGSIVVTAYSPSNESNNLELFRSNYGLDAAATEATEP